MGLSRLIFFAFGFLGFFFVLEFSAFETSNSLEIQSNGIQTDRLHMNSKTENITHGKFANLKTPLKLWQKSAESSYLIKNFLHSKSQTFLYIFSDYCSLISRFRIVVFREIILLSSFVLLHLTYVFSLMELDEIIDILICVNLGCSFYRNPSFLAL